MHSSNLIKLLKCLDKREMTQLGKFLNSPYHNSNKVATDLFEVLKKDHPNYQNKNLFKPTVFKKIFPAKKYDEKRINKKISELNKLINEFIVIQKFKEKEHLRHLLKAEFLAHKEGGVLFKKHVEKTEGSFVPKNGDEQWAMLQLKLLWYSSSISEKAEDVVGFIPDLFAMLDKAWANKRSKILAASVSRERVIQDSAYLENFDLFKKYVTDNNLLKNNPTILLTFRVVDMMLNDDHSSLSFCQKYFKKNIASFAFDDAKDLFLLLTNQIIYWYRTQSKKYLKPMFEWYKYGMEQDMFIENGIMRHQTYINISSTAALCGDYEYAQLFNQKNAKYLPEKEKYQCRQYCDAYCFFMQGDFKNAYDLRPASSFVTIRLENNFRMLEIRCLTELSIVDKEQYHHLLNSRLSSFEKHIYRSKKIAEKELLRMSNFIKILKRISTVLEQEKPSIVILRRIKKDLTEMFLVVAKAWLLLKVKELVDGKAHGK